MKLLLGMKTLVYTLALSALALVGVNKLTAGEYEAVSSRVSPDYVREKLQDGSHGCLISAYRKVC
jgi:hypothetical protein